MANVSVGQVLTAGCLFFGLYVLWMHHKLSASHTKAKQTGSWTTTKLQSELSKAEFLEQVASEQLSAVHESATKAGELLKLTQELRRIHGGPSRAADRAAADATGAAGKGLGPRNFTARMHNTPLKPWPGVPRDVFGSQPIDETTAKRREAVREAMRHAWGSYVQYAWGQDELAPQSKNGKDTFGGLGATIVDALDTLWLMEMTEEYERARAWIRDELRFDRDYDASVFETTIRVMGGMLAAYDLTGDEMYVRRSQELADRLLYAFDTETGIPLNSLNLDSLVAHNPAWAKGASTLSEFGTEQMEFVRLSVVTGEPVYAEKAERSIQKLHEVYPDRGLMPIFVDPHTGKLTKDQVSLGALGDSYYEYLLKTWILKGKTDEMYRDMWEDAMDEMIEKLVQSLEPKGIKYVAEMYRGRVRHKMDHLVCFVPGMLALGAHVGAVDGPKAEKYMQLAKELTKTCWLMYQRMPTGLAPEYTQFIRGRDMHPGAKHNLLRPEAVESFFILWRVTGDPVYKEWGWNVFQAFEKYCKMEAGYAGLKDVRKLPPKNDDTQQSFFLAETLKYLYLLFSPVDTLPLDAWVLNTEAHPLRVVPHVA